MGEGNPYAEILCLGEALGADEEALQRPFVGTAGHFLNRAIQEAGLTRSEVWVTNSIRCRPINAQGKNRTPTGKELEHCRGWFDDERARLPNVKVIVALGASASWTALAPDNPTGGVLENQGRVFWSQRYGCWVITSLHPAYIARKQSEILWLTIDLIKARRIAHEGQPPEPLAPKFDVITTYAQAEAMRDTLLRSRRIYFDWETNGLSLVNSRGFMIGFSTAERPDFAHVLPLYGAGFTPIWHRHDLARIKEHVLLPIMDSDVEKGGQHVAYDGAITKTELGIYPRNIKTDLMIAHQLVNNHLNERAHGLKRLSECYTGYGRYDDPLDRWLVENGYTRDGKPDGGELWRAPDHLTRPYNASDCIVTATVTPIAEKMVQEAGLWDIYTNERIPLMLDYMEMDRDGQLIDQQRLSTLGADLDTSMTAVATRLHELTGDTQFNANSPVQVSHYLFDVRGLPIIARTDTGAPSTKEEVLKEFELQEPVVPLILHYRAYSKLKGSFVDGSRHQVGGLKAAIDLDGRARTSTLLHTVETFRLATRKPFPIHTIPRPLVVWNCDSGHGQYLFDKCCEAAYRVTLSVRSLIIPDPGHLFVEADYVQQEYCLSPQSRVLCADLIWRKVQDLNIGDEIVGFDEALGYGQKKGDHGIRMQKGHVTSKDVVFLPAYRVVTDLGEIVASADHRWVRPAGAFSRGLAKWTPATWVRTESLHPGDQLQYALEPWETDTSSYEAGYLAAMFDGEGSVGANSVSFGQLPGAVVEQSVRFAELLGLKFELRQISLNEKPYTVFKLPTREHQLRFLGTVRPVRLLPKAEVLWNGRRLLGSTKKVATVISVEPLGASALVALGTSTKTYIAEGFLSHNCVAAIISGQQDWEEAMLDRREDAHEFVMKLLSGRTKMEYGALDAAGEFQFHSRQHADDYKNLRSDYKRINFMILFRGGARSLARSLSTRADPRTGAPERIVTESDAATMIEEYYDRLYNVKLWQYARIMEARKTGMVLSPMGTRRKVPGIYSPNKFDQFEAERQAVNFPIQASGAHVTMRAIVALNRYFREHKFPAKVRFSVHDEIVTQVREDVVDEGQEIIKTIMQQPHPELVGGCGIPRGILVDIKVTQAWGGMPEEARVPVVV
jgi:uracil-DNA glycosylase family 4